MFCFFKKEPTSNERNSASVKQVIGHCEFYFPPRIVYLQCSLKDSYVQSVEEENETSLFISIQIIVQK